MAIESIMIVLKDLKYWR